VPEPNRRPVPNRKRSSKKVIDCGGDNDWNPALAAFDSAPAPKEIGCAAWPPLALSGDFQSVG